MAASKSPHTRLLHMKQEMDWMLERFSGGSYEAFVADVIHVRAVEHGFLIISEAVKSLPDTLLLDYPDIEWHAIRGFGNILRHDYQQIDPRRLWFTLTHHLPKLREVVVALLEKDQPSG